MLCKSCVTFLCALRFQLKMNRQNDTVKHSLRSKSAWRCRFCCQMQRIRYIRRCFRLFSAWRSEVQVLDQRTDIPPVALFHWNCNRCNEIATHLEHYSCKTVTGAHLFHPSLPSFVISTERSEWRYPYRFHIKSIVSCRTYHQIIHLKAIWVTGTTWIARFMYHL